MARQLVLDGFGVIEASNGRYYPAYVHYGSNGHRLYCAALSPQSLPYLLVSASADEQQTISFTRKFDALMYCQHQAEYDQLSSEWEKQAVSAAFHPDRTSWYQEEITRLLVTHTEVLWEVCIRFLPYPDGVAAWVSCFLKGIYESINVHAATIDKAWEALYQKVYETLIGEVMQYNAQTRRYEGRCGGRVVQIQPDVFEHTLAHTCPQEAQDLSQPAYWANVLDEEEDWQDWKDWQHWQESHQAEASVRILSLQGGQS